MLRVNKILYRKSGLNAQHGAMLADAQKYSYLEPVGRIPETWYIASRTLAHQSLF